MIEYCHNLAIMIAIMTPNAICDCNKNIAIYCNSNQLRWNPGHDVDNDLDNSTATKIQLQQAITVAIYTTFTLL